MLKMWKHARNSELEFVSSADSMCSWTTKTMITSTLSDIDSAVLLWPKQTELFLDQWWVQKLYGFIIIWKFVCLSRVAFRFQKRHDIRLLDIQGESLSSNFVAANSFFENFHFLNPIYLPRRFSLWMSLGFGGFWKMLPSNNLRLFRKSRLLITNLAMKRSSLLLVPKL